MIFRNWKSKGEYKANCAKQEQDINRLNERIDDSENVEAIQLGIIARLQSENTELRAEIERLKAENLTQGFECVGVSAI
ncbi:hypothetical protein GMC98_03215 [Ruminococcus bromii]|nr:hypothetical protein [Ruminococcus bromii]MTQ93795.1 hypothetical protein [Ruminococcus bromii]MTR78150.1 hypothetical protein [Ruminococcus bromii]MTR87955.1 hypothetical protein [Ruminococcus bromii]